MKIIQIISAPAVSHRRSREPWLVTMRLADRMTLYSHQKAVKTAEKKRRCNF